MKLDSRFGLGIFVAAVVAGVTWFVWPEPEPEETVEEPEEPEEPPGPCDVLPDPLMAQRLNGPYDTFEDLCARWGEGDCERIEAAPSDNFLPFEDLSFIRRPVAEEEQDDKVAVGLAVQLDGKWWVQPEMSARREDLAQHSFVHRPRDEAPPMLQIDAVWERRFYHSPGDPNGAVQVLERRAMYLCSADARGRPSCAYVPWRWSRETRRPGEEPSDIAVSQLTPTWCDNGLLLVEGTTERLSRDNEALVERLLGLNEPTFR